MFEKIAAVFIQLRAKLLKSLFYTHNYDIATTNKYFTFAYREKVWKLTAILKMNHLSGAMPENGVSVLNAPTWNPLEKESAVTTFKNV